MVFCVGNGNIMGAAEYERQPENLFDYLYLIEVAKDYRGTGVAGQLLAYVAQDSLAAGFEGFVVFESKTALYQYYQVKYGAKPLGGRKLYFDTEAAHHLIKLYLEDEEDDE
jgi:GNAT superfamily N-acetyltransferase